MRLGRCGRGIGCGEWIFIKLKRLIIDLLQEAGAVGAAGVTMVGVMTAGVTGMTVVSSIPAPTLAAATPATALAATPATALAASLASALAASLAGVTAAGTRLPATCRYVRIKMKMFVQTQTC
jgi:hypothetical protein